jgi:hypothetical protein
MKVLFIVAATDTPLPLRITDVIIFNLDSQTTYLTEMSRAFTQSHYKNH